MPHATVARTGKFRHLLGGNLAWAIQRGRMGTQTQFQDFLRDIEPSSTTKTNSSSAHRGLRDFLADHDDFVEVHLDTFLSGSYARDTSIRPSTRDGKVSRPDIDIIVVTNHALSDKPSDVLWLLRSSLKDGYELDAAPHTRSVGVVTSLVEMDAVPLIAPDGMSGSLWLPDKKAEQWIVTNPPGHTTWSTEVNRKAGNRFKPLVKITKWWRRENPTLSKRPKGFVIECIVAECMSYTETSYPELFVGALERIVAKYAASIVRKQVPWIADPSVLSKSVTEQLSFDAFEGFYNKARAHAALGRKALKETDDEKALVMWRQILGPRFPERGKRQAGSLLSAAATPTPFTFPDRPIIPEKPRGFA